MKIWSIVGIIFIVILCFIGVGILSFVVYWISNAAIEFVNKAASYFLDCQKKWWINQETKLKANIHVINPDEHGFNGVAWNGKTYLNLDTGEVIENRVKAALTPIKQELWQIRQQNYEQRKLLVAMGNINFSTEQKQALIEQTQNTPRLPQQVKLLDIVDISTMSLENLTIGVTINEYGEIIPIMRSIHDLMHLLAIGITGAGKSTWVLAFLAEIAMCQEQIEVCAIDVHGSAFNIMQNWSKLRYPIARTNEQAKVILMEVKRESERRMRLYEQTPLADNLPSYNCLCENEQLIPWLIVIDEGTIMLADSSISQYIASAVQGTRQYGIYIFMTGQTAKSNVIDTPIRDNFPTRLAFNNERTSLKVALGETPEGDFDEIPGRCWARLKGQRKPFQIQAPYIRRQDFYQLIDHNGPKYNMPISETDAMSFDELVNDAYVKLGSNISAICKELGLSTGGNDFYRVKNSMDSQGLL